MKYFYLKKDTTKIGYSPSIKAIKKFNVPHDRYKIRLVLDSSVELIGQKIAEVQMHYRARFCSILSMHNIHPYHLISSALFDVFKNRLSTSLYNYFYVDVIKNKKKELYVFFGFKNHFLIEVIDFPNSTFVNASMKNRAERRDPEIIKVNSGEEYFIKRKENTLDFNPKPITLKLKKGIPQDVFLLPFSVNYIISEALKSGLAHNQDLEGLKFEELNFDLTY